MKDNSHSIILDYKKEWIDKFAKEKESLEDMLGDLVLEIENIGSTAIPGLSSKPIIDILIMINIIGDRDIVGEKLIQLGYVSKLPGNERDFYVKGKPIEYHVSVCFPERGGFYVRQILFRDYLRKHPEEMVNYENLKKDLLRNDPTGVTTYIEGKTEFVYDILRKAGWTKDISYNEFHNLV